MCSPPPNIQCMDLVVWPRLGLVMTAASPALESSHKSELSTQSTARGQFQ